MANRRARGRQPSLNQARLPAQLGFEVGLAAAATWATAPLWLVAHPPIQDLPQHLAATRVLADYGDPSFAFSSYFELQPFRTQYLAYYGLAVVLSWVFGPLIANKLLLSLAILATPYAMRALLRSIGHDERLAVFSLPLLWNAHLILGFLNFIAAIPLSLFGLSLAVRYAALRRAALDASATAGRAHIRCALGLGAVALLCFYTHVVPYGLCMLGAGAVFVSRDLRRSAACALPLLPSLLAALIWTQRSPAGRSTLEAASGGGAHFASVLDNLRDLPRWLTDVLHTPADERAMVLYAGLMLAAGVLGLGAPAGRDPGDRVSSARYRLAWLAPLSAALYFLTPTGYGWIWPINARFPLLALLFLGLALPRLRGVAGATLLCGCLAVSFWSSSAVASAFRRVETEEVGQLDRALAAIPRGKMVAALVFDRASGHVKFSPFLHAAGWVQTERGGAVMFTFADFPQSPFRFREARRPPRVPPRWEWMPERVRPAEDLTEYDYILCRGHAPVMARQNLFQPIFQSPRWSVWKHRER